MAVWQGASDGATSTSPTPTGVVSNQLLHQLDPKGLDIGKLVGAGVVLHQDESICYRHIKQESENVFIKFPAFCPAAIVFSQLIPTVYSSHELVGYDTRRARDWDP